MDEGSNASYLGISCIVSVKSVVIGASLSELHHMIWQFEIIPWSMCKINAIRNILWNMVLWFIIKQTQIEMETIGLLENALKW